MLESLITLLTKFKTSTPEGWLYLQDDDSWNLDTLGIIIDDSKLTDDLLDNEGEPLVIKKFNLVSTMDCGTIDAIIDCAKEIQNPISDDILLDAFLYYYNNDAFLRE